MDHRVVIVAPIGRDAELIAAALAPVGIAVTACANIDPVLAEVSRGAAGVMVTEETLDAHGLDGLTAIVQGQPPWSDLPIVVLTSADHAGRPANGLVRRLAPLGNITFLERPVRRMTLVSTVLAALRARRRQYEVRDHLVERERAAAEVRERAEHTERLNRAKDEFLAMLGHELRNPIGAIAAAVRVLELAGRHDGPVRTAFDVIDRQTTHLGRLVNDLLDVSRVTTGRIVLDRRPLDLGGLVARCVRTLGAAAGDASRLTVTTDAVWVVGDETRLEQIVSNLVVNALKYTPAQGRIDVSLGAAEGGAVLRVSDTGLGIPAEVLPRIFELFFQVDHALERAKGGLGIGLTLVRRLVELHGGTVDVTSAGVGHGSTFTVRVPAVAAPVPPATPAVPGEGGGERLTILLVEDNADSRDMLAHMLRLKGHEVHEAADGVTGVAETLRLTPDVAIIDIGLPGLSGYDVARQIRADPRGDGISLIALTGYGQQEDRRRALEAGFDTHLVKPVDPARLAAVLVRRAGPAPTR
jgi:signal transduction histidine kinase/ActR/RegA family two-component response regulator